MDTLDTILKYTDNPISIAKIKSIIKADINIAWYDMDKNSIVIELFHESKYMCCGKINDIDFDDMINFLYEKSPHRNKKEYATYIKQAKQNYEDDYPYLIDANELGLI